MKDTKVKENGKIDYVWYKNQYDRLLSEKCRLEKENDELQEDVEYWKSRYDNLLKMTGVE